MAMNVSVSPVSRDRLLCMATRDEDVASVLRRHSGRPVVALLSSASGQPELFEAVVQALLDGGCHFFVCHGLVSEELHDRVDDLIIDQGPLEVVTTWHDDESDSEVVEFFLHVAGRERRSLLVVVLEEHQPAFANQILEQACQ